ncbi:hypothetical protein QIA17_00155 (plasmid) [Borreliella californiensis]|uniref:Uncharacterized protein n=1 Tax=Borreliella californiensis TaxID=373543 RepID=A0A7X0DQS4_9SPIR|nr:hypothetical protein [Borreliella californiensis]MBB6213669.1 hypothetical protein [Borreliella californiensis]MBB6213694.1 hypothetical protein [Borreliella californiensis]WKC91252.1 hypothetical protein QIA17_00155 [Borreliella californiensis]WNY70912.1 hypothetical protein QIA39_04405 [Borreliella californiensis]
MKNNFGIKDIIENNGLFNRDLESVVIGSLIDSTFFKIFMVNLHTKGVPIASIISA